MFLHPLVVDSLVILAGVTSLEKIKTHSSLELVVSSSVTDSLLSSDYFMDEAQWQSIRHKGYLLLAGSLSQTSVQSISSNHASAKLKRRPYRSFRHGYPINSQEFSLCNRLHNQKLIPRNYFYVIYYVI